MATRTTRNVNDSIDEIVLEVNAELAAIQEDIDNASLKIYLARFAQSGTSNPVVTEFLNTTGQTFTWTRHSLGRYRCTMARPFIGGFNTFDVTSPARINFTGGFYIEIAHKTTYLEIFVKNGMEELVEYSTAFDNFSGGSDPLDLPVFYFS
jgi:hypothetical protein